MELEALLEKQGTAIAQKWFDRVVKTYPSDTSQFLKQQTDPFANPVGDTTRKNLEAIIQELLNGTDYDSLVSFLDPIIRIRAVQSFTPSNAIGFIGSLKDVIREEVESELGDPELVNSLLQFERKIDSLSLTAFDIYMSCREKIYQIRANQEQERALRAFKRAGLIADNDGS